MPQYGLVERRRRAAARAALYGSLALVAAATFAARTFLHLPPTGGPETNWFGVAWESKTPVRLLQQYLRIDTTEATGDELAAALFLATPLEAAGIPVHIETVGKHTNLWAELRGDDPRPLILLSHMDVEPVLTPDEWAHPAFAGVIDPPYLVGRGAFDMKSYTIAQLLALLDLEAKHPRPRRSVLLMATAGEESGSDLGMRWLVAEHPELFRNAWAVITEGGVVEARSLESLKYWGIEVGQKRFAEAVACAPTRHRLLELRQDIVDAGFRSTGLEVDPQVRRFWQVYRSSRDLPALRRLLADPAAFVHDPAEFLDLPGYLRSMLRNELIPFQPEPAAGGGFQMRLIFHLLPGADLEAARRDLLPEWMTGGVALAFRAPPPPAAISAEDHPVVAAIDAELRRDYGRPLVGPYFLPWSASDSRFLRPLGIPCYGFAPFLLLTPETERMGRNNEQITLPGLVQGTDLYRRVVERLATAEQ
ncbi:MAG TPA: M20/M25/M40 family metallo-hydrolase [Thermoanaerobaculia bacterium]|jgi:acetylornithine deacetylase/succinyl-diaminopimelate desuccinylase-like protein|nr:M20/M25/M40 family metallo-hydrolase [Thermoanaerobaculia bacterium]